MTVRDPVFYQPQEVSMNRLLNFTVLLLFMFQTVALAAPYRRRSSDVYVNGYTRSDGTYVRSHYRSAPDSSTSNNYGSWDYSGGGGDNYGW